MPPSHPSNMPFIQYPLVATSYQLVITGWQECCSLFLKNPFMIHSWMRADDSRKSILMMPVHFMWLSDSSRVALCVSSRSMWNCWFLEMVSKLLCTPASTPSMYLRSLLSMMLTKGSFSAQKSKLTLRSVLSVEAMVTVIYALPQSEANYRSVPVWLYMLWPLQSMVTVTSCFSWPDETAQKVCLPVVSKTSCTEGLSAVRSSLMEEAAIASKSRVANALWVFIMVIIWVRICGDLIQFAQYLHFFHRSSMSFQLAERSRMEAEEEELPHSSCSIEENPLSSKNVYSDRRVGWEDKKEKSMKYIGDRFFPVRKMPCSAKDLFNDHTEWMEDEENDADSPKRHEKRGMTVRDVYKMEVLGDGSAFRDHDIDTFSNENFLRFSYKDDTRSQNDPRNFHNGLLQFPEDHLPVKKQKERKISKIPAKVLDAPALYDDFYLNLVDWSSTNLLAVGLSNSVYLWNAGNSKVVRLVELPPSDLVTSTCSSPSSNVLGVGTHSGEVQLWDCVKHKKILTCRGHTARVGAISWNTNNVFASGSRDKNILVRDIRVQEDYINKMVGHKQEVCGLKWSFDQQQLASGGNDNRLNIWSMHSSTPTFNLLRHTAAVKALAWSPHQHGLLVSGGGTADRTIRFWNSITGEETKCLNVGSQVCNLMFAKTVNELVSTHGYSLNEINIWKMPKMEKIETLTGHTYRVLYLAMNPDGTTIVTGAGDETLRFWNIFPKKEKEQKEKSSLNTESICLR